MKRKYWTAQEERFIVKNISKMSIKEFSSHFGVDYFKVVDKIHKMGLNSKQARGVIWCPEDDAILKEHFEYAPQNYLKELFPDRSWVGIFQRGLKTLNLQRQTRDTTYVNYRFFDKWTPESVYVHGFMLADGHVHLGKDNLFQIELEKDSYDILQKIKAAMDFKGRIYYLDKRNTYKLQIKNVYLIKRLIETGVTDKDKSLRALYPYTTPDCFLRDHIRGIIDGDGWSYIDSEGRYNLGLCGTKHVVSTVKRLLPIDDSMNSIQHYEKNCWRFNFRDKRALKIASWLYDDSSIYLDKKYNAYKQAQLMYSPSYGKPCEDRT